MSIYKNVFINNLIFLGSSCIYPKLSNQPIKESELLSGPLEKTNQWYAIAKIAGIKLCESFNIQYNNNSDNEINLESKVGANVGMEIAIPTSADWWNFNTFKVGGAFVQRGTNRDSGFDLYNYVTGHALYYIHWGSSTGSLNLDKNFPIYIGFGNRIHEA